MDKQSKTERLHQLMAQYDLSAPDVAAILGRTPHTVRVWRSIHELRIIPDDALALLELKAPLYAAARKQTSRARA
jgi:hypothetical protein